MSMWAELLEAATRALSSPITHGMSGGLVRWAVGDRVGGWRSLLWHLVISAGVAWAVSLYLVDEISSAPRRDFWIVLGAFVARDLLLAIVGIGGKFREDPFGTFRAVKDSLMGGTPPRDKEQK